MMPVSVISSPGIQILTKSSRSSTSSTLGTLPLFSCKMTYINIVYNFMNILCQNTLNSFLILQSI